MLDQATVRDLAKLTDEIGVLSVYSTMDPHEEVPGKPARRIRLENELRALKERVSEKGKEFANTVFPRLERLRTQLDDLIDRHETGVGRALFAPLSGEDVFTFAIQLPLGDLAVLEPSPRLRPLVTASSTGAPAGIMAVSRDGVRMVDLRYGRACNAASMRVDVNTEDWPRMQGPRAASPGTYASSHAQNDLFDRRLEDHQIRSLVALAPQIEAESKKLAWETLVLAGDPRIVEPLAGALKSGGPQEGRQILQVEQRGDAALSPSDMAAAVAPEILKARKERAAQLVSQVQDSALSGGPGSLGFGDTLGALQESGRIRHLLLNESGAWEGHRTADGRLYPLDELPPDDSEATGVGDLGEQMIKLALAGGADITVLDADAAAPLAENDGVAALLRW